MSDSLTPKQELFCQKYVELLYEGQGEVTNASAAYRAAYDAEKMKPTTVWREAGVLMHNLKVVARIAQLKEQHLRRHNVTVDRVLQEYTRLAFLDIRRAFDDEGRLKNIHDLDDDTAAAISGIEAEDLYEGRGESREHVGRLHKVRLSDKKAALDSLARHLGMFKDAQPGGVTLNLAGQVNVYLPDNGRDQRD